MTWLNIMAWLVWAQQLFFDFLSLPLYMTSHFLFLLLNRRMRQCSAHSNQLTNQIAHCKCEEGACGSRLEPAYYWQLNKETHITRWVAEDQKEVCILIKIITFSTLSVHKLGYTICCHHYYEYMVGDVSFF